MRPAVTIIAFSVAALLAAGGVAQEAGSSDPVPVTVDNFTRAESDMYFAKTADKVGLGKFDHRREVADVADQTVIRMNRDTLYSPAVVDLDAGPVTITLPDAGDRFMSLMLLNEDQYVVSVTYGDAPVTVTKDDAGTRYLIAAVRTLVDPNDPADLQKVHALQDAMTITQAGTGSFEIPKWDEASQNKVRDALLVLASTTALGPDTFGSKSEVDPIHHLIGTAAGWGGNPAKDATYVSVVPAQNDGKTAYRLQVGEVPVDGFWSISVYNAKGFFEPNDLNAYSVNNITANKAADGSVDVQFGNCDGKVPNCLPTVDGWNYLVRLYRPRAEILDGTWKFPEAQPMS